MKKKIVMFVGLLAILTGINMQVNALNPADGITGESHHINTQQSLNEWVPDKNLQQALVETMGLKDITELTPDLLQNYEGNINLRARQITNIKGLEYATKAPSIDLGMNKFSDISALSSLAQVENLALNYNEINDITPLAGMKSLVKLDISKNEIASLTPLHDLKDLKEITFHYNKIKDLTVLRGMESLTILKGTMQGVYNETLNGEVKEVIKQQNNVLNYMGEKPDLTPYGGGSDFGKYNKDIQTVEWTYDTPGNKVGSSKFYTTYSAGSSIILEFGGTVTQPIKIAGDQTNIIVKDTELYVGDKWEPKDNLVKAVNQDGEPIEIGDINIEGSVNTSKAGLYKVKYTILNAKNEQVSQEAKITVVEDKTSIKVKDSTINLGDKWRAKDNFVSATDRDGKPLSFETEVMVSGKVDSNKQGNYNIRYSVLDRKNNTVSAVATITVVGDQTSIEVKDSTLYTGDEWKPENNLVKATDASGNAVDIKDITIEGNVDTSKAGIYQVTYSVLNSAKEKVSKEATVNVKADQTNLEVKNSTVYLGDKWTAEDNLVKAIDKDGKPFHIKDIIIEGSVDTTKAGTYQVVYTIFSHKHEKISKEAKISVKEDQTSITVKDSQLYIGDQWNAEDNFVSTTDKNGNPLAFKDVIVEGEVNTAKAGDYLIEYSVLGNSGAHISKKAKVSVKEDQTTLEVKDSVLYFGDIWQPEDNIVKAVDQDGKNLDVKNITVEGSVETSKEGISTVKYTILNHQNEKISEVATITVRGNDLTSIEVKDSTLYVGDTWNQADNFVKALDKDGQMIDIKDVNVEGKVDTTKEGINKVKYTVLNHLNEKISKEATITVRSDETTLEVKDSTLYAGDTWSQEDNVVKAIDQDGNDIDIKDIIVEGFVNPTSEGTYKVTYTILNHIQEKISKEATITVKGEDLTALEVRNSTLYQGDTWKPEDNIVKAVDKDGKDIDIQDVTVDGDVDVDTEGTYTVTYNIANHANEKISKEATITVKGQDLTTLEVKDIRLYLNEKWNPADNVVKAIDKDGEDIVIKDITVEGNVDTTKEGVYKVMYTILNHKSEKISKEAIITVKGQDLTSLEVKDSTLYFGDRWRPEDNLVKATDKDGNPLGIYDVDVKGDVDIKTAGEYPIEYTVYNNAKEKITKVATITMKGHDYTYLEVDDSTLYVGDTWNPADNLIKARDKDSNELGIEDVIIEGNVDTNRVGTYEVVYALLNHNNDKLSNIATITIKEDQTNLQVENSTIYLDDQWNPADNLVKAVDKDGNSVSLKDIAVDGNVDTRRTGINKVKYTILNHKTEKVMKTATITVKEDLTNIEVKDSTLYLRDSWSPADNLVKAIDQDGQTIDIKNIKVNGHVDTTRVGVYQVTYSIYNHRKEKINQLASIKVKEDQTSLIVKDSELYRDDEWKPSDNIVEAIDKDGNAIEDIIIVTPLADDKENKTKVIIEGNVNTSKEGVSKLTYTIFDHTNTKITKEVAVNIKLDKTSLQVKDTIIRLNSKWKPADNLVRAMDQDGKVLNIKDVSVEGKVNTRKAGEYQVTYTLKNHTDKKISKKATVTVQKKNNGNANGKDGNSNLPKTGYDMSIIGPLLGLAGVLGFISLYLNRRERKE